MDDRVRKAMQDVLRTSPGNPSSMHAGGRVAREMVETARRQVATLINSAPTSIFFTSGATEADNLAVLGVARAERARGRHLVSVKTEHRAVLDPLSQLAREGFRITLLRPDHDGLLSSTALEAALTPETTLVSVMLVNNEIGVVQDIAAIGAVCRRHGVWLHVDAAQAAGRVAIDVEALGCDLLSLSAHKIHGPIGIGALYVRPDPRLRPVPLSLGGGQEGGLRPGTLPVHQIVGMGTAYALAGACQAEETARLGALIQRLWGRLSELPDVFNNGHATARAPHILNVTFAGVDGEALRFELPNLCVSSGSACSAGDAESSYVLRALGRTDPEAAASLRFSVGRPTTVEEIDQAADQVIAAVRKLRALAPQ
jgi:cysteine desulfurase